MRKINLLLVFGLIITLFSCDKDEEITPQTKVTIQISVPDGIESMDEISITLKDVNTGTQRVVSTEADGTAIITVDEGVYNIIASGEKEHTTDVGGESFTRTVSLAGLKENKSIEGETMNIDLSLFIVIKSKGWVFKELYYTGSRTPEDKSYYKDKYFEIYNNSNEVLYADGISLAESDHGTYKEENEWTTILGEPTYVAHTIYTIPGSGKEHAVNPGESVILCDVGINHKEVNANSFDLSKADFEWYDEHKLDVDVPEVPNLIKNFSYSKSIWTPHNRGYRSYILFRAEGTMEDFLINNEVQRSNASGSRITIRYKVPSNLILDAVEVSTPSKFVSKAVPVGLDISYTHTGDSDDIRYGKCVRRKVLRWDGTRAILTDTNNSAEDFESTVTPNPGKI